MAAEVLEKDERYFVIDGRRWRRSDPSIPDALRTELVRELMSARRSVGSAKRARAAAAERAARARVNDAKVALGERGHPYWQAPDDTALRIRAAATMRALLAARGPDKTICPSDVARVIGGESWRARMLLVRQVAIEMVERAELEIRQRGKRVVGKTVKGPIRLGLVCCDE